MATTPIWTSLGNNFKYALKIDDDYLQTPTIEPVPIYPTESTHNSYLIVDFGTPAKEGDTMVLFVDGELLETQAISGEQTITYRLPLSALRTGKYARATYTILTSFYGDDGQKLCNDISFNIAPAKELAPSVSVTLESERNRAKKVFKDCEGVRVRGSVTQIIEAAYNLTISGTNFKEFSKETDKTIINQYSDTITRAGEATYTVTATNQFGQSTTVTQSIPVVDYTKPTIFLSAHRCTSDGTADDGGDYCIVTAEGHVFVDDYNERTRVIIYFDGVQMATFQSETNGNYSFTTEPLAADPDKTILIIGRVGDSLFPSLLATGMRLSTAFTVMDFLDGGRGVALGTNITAGDLTTHDATSLFLSGMAKNVFNGPIVAGDGTGAELAKLDGKTYPSNGGVLEVKHPGGNKMRLFELSKGTTGAIDSLDDSNTITGRISWPNDLTLNLQNVFEWKEAVPTGTDLNTVTAPGRYYLNGSWTYSNMPAGVTYGHLLVLRNSNTNTGVVITQIIISSNVSTIIKARMSSNSGSTWANWYGPWQYNPAVATTTDVNDLTVNDIGRTNILSGASVANLPDTAHSYHVLGFGNVQLARQTTAPYTVYARRYNNAWEEWCPVSGSLLTETFTYKGLTIVARKHGRNVMVQISGTTTEELATSSAYVDLCTLSTAFRPSTQFVNRCWLSINRAGNVVVTTGGKVQIGYGRYPNGTGGYVNSTLASGSTIYTVANYMSAS